MLHPDTEHQVLISFVRERCDQTQARNAKLATSDATPSRLARLLASSGDLFIAVGTTMKRRAHDSRTSTMPAGIVEVK